MSLRRYARYKPSGVDWVGDIPAHWRIASLKRSFRVINGGTPASHNDAYWDGEIPWVTPDDLGRLRNQRITGGARTISLEGLQNSGAQLVPTSSIVLSTRAPIGHVAIAEAELSTNQGCRCLVPVTLVSSTYFYYALMASKLVIQATGKGTTFLELSSSALGAHLVPVPPVIEQSTIAEHLNQVCGRLDVLIAKKRALIGKLQEKRSALISRIVTRGLPPGAARAAGLNPRPRLKPSGIDWSGEIPECWQAGNLRRFAQMKTGHTPSRQHPEYWEDCEIPWFTLADVWQLRDETRDFLGDTQEKISDLGLANSAAELLPAGTVILSRTASVGFSGIMPQPMATSQDFWNWVCGRELLPKYLLFLFRAMRAWLSALMMGSTHPTIYQAQAAGLAVCVPPLGQQQVIVDFLDCETAKIRRMIEKIEEVITRLQEYRTALITAAVTGKIDVREAIPVNEPAALVAAG